MASLCPGTAICTALVFAAILPEETGAEKGESGDPRSYQHPCAVFRSQQPDAVRALGGRYPGVGEEDGQRGRRIGSLRAQSTAGTRAEDREPQAGVACIRATANTP